MKRIFILSFILSFISIRVFSQGCVAVRGAGGMCMLGHNGNDATKWQFSFSNRYYRSYKHFVGTDEQKQRQDLGTEVINHAYTGELALTYAINPRWSVSMMAPILSNARSSLYEHGGNIRRSTHSFGIGDLRITAYTMLLNPARYRTWNIQAGLGLKLPTGDYKVMDYFYSGTNNAKVLGPVDQSIQLGDGGTGITSELNGYYNLSHTVSFYGTAYYLVSPREYNGVSTARGGVPSTSAIANGSDIMSVPDQWMLRAGANILTGKFLFSLGLRKECLPAKDLVGGSNGFRRPGYIVSVEPGITLHQKKMNLYLQLPWAVKRNRTQSVPDKLRTDLTGVYSHGDAAFADYSWNFGIQVKF